MIVHYVKSRSIPNSIIGCLVAVGNEDGFDEIQVGWSAYSPEEKEHGIPFKKEKAKTIAFGRAEKNCKGLFKPYFGIEGTYWNKEDVQIAFYDFVKRAKKYFKDQELSKPIQDMFDGSLES